MSAEPLRRYRFATEAQWNACLLVQADRVSLPAGVALHPFAAYERDPLLYASPGAHAPVVTRVGEVLWRDDAGCLHRVSPCDDDADRSVTCPAPPAIARATRIVATPNSLWVIGDEPDSLHRYEDDSLSRVLTTRIPDARIIDIASDGRRSIYALAAHEGKWRAVRVEARGRIAGHVTFEGISEPVAFVFLRRSQRFVLLVGKRKEDGRHQRLYWFRATGGAPLFSTAVAGLRPCFAAKVIGSDARDRLFVAGADRDDVNAGAHVVILDADGNTLGDVPLDPHVADATGVAATRDRLFVTGPQGLLRFAATQVVPEEAEQVRATLMTPVLFSPDREDQRRWLRVEASAALPEGSTLEMSYAATDGQAVRDRLQALAADESMTASQRVNRLLSDPELRRGRTEVHYGSDAHATGDRAPFSAKLFDVRERYLWVTITLTASAGARLPRLTELAILYPGRTLMEHLPSIYQREEVNPDSFLRGLVGVLEATTQDLDGRIGSMGSRVHPATASGPWLDFIADWTGVPWDDALTTEQKGRILARAGELAELRGTRAGLEALLECLMPDTPRRFRVTDATAEHGFAILGGGEHCTGSSLPAMLGGRTAWSAELGSRSVLGFMRLPCENQLDDGVWQIAGLVVIEVAATADERARWAPWLRSLIAQMVPLTARVTLRWVGAHALASQRLDDTMTLEPPPLPHLGTGAITSLARLPERGVRLSRSGPSISRRLG